MKKNLYIIALLLIAASSAYSMGWRGVNVNKGAVTADKFSTQYSATTSMPNQSTLNLNEETEEMQPVFGQSCATKQYQPTPASESMTEEEESSDETSSDTSSSSSEMKY